MKLSRKQLWFARMFFGEFMPWAFRWADRAGYEVMVLEVLRSEAAARANAKAGTGIVKSNHRVKLAADILLWKDGKPVWTVEPYRKLGEKWESMTRPVTSIEKVVCCWGGRFRRRKDPWHFSFLHNGVK